MKNELEEEFFRASVGAIIINKKGKVLVFERVKQENEWQFIQGGINRNENPQDAIYREIKEETSIKKESLNLIDEYPFWIAYELPEKYRHPKYGRGQVQKWFLFEFIGEEKEINISKVKEVEFSNWSWKKIDETIANVTQFRKRVYIELNKYWKNNLEQ